MIRRDVERRGRGRRAEQAVILLRRGGEKEAREAPGERRLAHTARPRQQPAVVQPAAGIGGQEFGLGPGLAQKLRGLARVRGAGDLVGQGKVGIGHTP